MFNNKDALEIEQLEEYITPAFLQDNYPYKAISKEIKNAENLIDGVVYEIKCKVCEMSIRSQGQNIKKIYGRLKSNGCIGCGKKELIIRKVNMNVSLKTKI